MKLHIAKTHQDKGYFITAQKDGKQGGLQMYRGIFAVYDEMSGNWHPKSQGGFTSKRDAKGWAEDQHEVLNEKGRDATIASMRGKTNFAVFLEKHYKDYLENDREIKGIDQEFQKLDVLVEFFGGDKIENIGLLRIREFKSWLLKRPYTRKEGGKEFYITKTTSHRYLARLKHVLRYAADTLGTRVPPFRDLIRKSDEKPKGIKFTFGELQRMLSACYRLFPRKPENRKRWRLVLIAAYTLGCRVDELYHIVGENIKYVDEVARVGLIELNMVDSRNKIHTKKMPITTWLFEEMQAAGTFDKAAGERLFMWTKAYRKPFENIKKEAKVNSEGTFHTLRATSTTDKAASGQDLEAIQQEVGHRKGSNVTSRHYIHFEDRQIIEAASSFNERLERIRKSDDVLDAEILDESMNRT